jgi:malate dehydrogenase (oxaloacetate-decarboxylating)
MFEFKILHDATGGISRVETSLNGRNLLNCPQLNKGCAFNREERDLFELNGLLPHQIETLDQQAARMYVQYQEHKQNLAKNIYLNVLHDYNETLFFKLVHDHLEEMIPIIYTPTVGEAVQHFSLEHRKPQGLYLSYHERDSIEAILDAHSPEAVDLAVITDGEAILGIGDQGIGGINISSAKLMVYTLCGGIHPHRVLPIQLDVGTNNPLLLNDPMYLGCRHERIQGQEYDDFIEKFVQAITRKFPNILLHWEDFGRDNARRILSRYQNKICAFNGDMQGTGVVALATILAGVAASQIPLTQHRVVILGAGTAGVGIADQIQAAFCRAGLSKEEARSHFWLIDKPGLLTRENTSLAFQTPYARDPAEIKTWQCADLKHIGLYEVVKHIHPTILIGCSTASGAFTEEIVKLMAEHTKRPIIMPLSNPTCLSEAIPEDLIKWTNARALIATGSPFADVHYADKIYRIAQSNNALAFPGIGLGCIAVRAKHLTDDMLWAATQALSECSPAYTNPEAPLLPKLAKARMVSFKVALAVAAQAQKEGLAQIKDAVHLPDLIKNAMWEPRYYPYRRV